MKQTVSDKKTFTQRIEQFFHKPLVEIVLLVLITIVYWSNYSANFNRKVDMNGDNIYYFALGQALADGKGYVNTIGFTETPHTHFPPGYPAYIALLQKIAPDNQQFIKKADGTLLFAAIILLFFLLKKLTGSVLIPFCACLLSSVQVDVLRFGSMMMSEPLYMFCSMVILYLALILQNSDLLDYHKWQNYVLLVVFLFFVAYVQFVRTIALALVLSLLLWLVVCAIKYGIKWLKQHDTVSKRRFFHFCLLFSLVLLSWYIPKQVWDARQEAVGKTGVAYQSQFMQKSGGGTMQTYDDWAERIGNNTRRHIVGYVPQAIFRTNWFPDQPTSISNWIVGISVLVLLLLGLFNMRQSAWLILFYVGATMAVLILYAQEYSTERYFIAIIPFFFFLFLNGAAYLIHLVLHKLFKIESTRVWQSLLVVVITFILIPTHVEAQESNRRMSQIKSWKSLGQSAFTDYISSAQWCGANLPDTARIYCRKPEIFYMYSNYHHSEMIPVNVEPDAVIAFFEQHHTQYVILDSWFPHAYRTIYPAVMAYPQRFELIHQEGKFDERQRSYPTFVLRFR